jgi:serine/threonine protein kinase
VEGDNVYLAPEVLEGVCGRSSDIFSLGLITLELAANIELPSQGDSWQRLRHEHFGDIRFETMISSRLRSLIFGMLRTSPHRRPTVEFIISEACMSVPIDFDMKRVFEAIVLPGKLTEKSPFD